MLKYIQNKVWFRISFLLLLFLRFFNAGAQQSVGQQTRLQPPGNTGRIFSNGVKQKSNAVTTPGSFTGANDYLLVTANQQAYFGYTSAGELLNEKKIENIFEVKVAAQSKSYNVSASIHFSGPGEQNFADKLSLVLTKKTSANALATPETSLSSVPRLLFTQRPVNSSGQLSSFFYDLVLHPLTSASPGNYDFTITFTMTQS